MAVMAATSRTATALLRSLHDHALKLRNHRYHFGGSGGGSSSLSPSTTASWSPVLAALVCTAAAVLFFFFPRAVAFFLPLVASTSAFCATAYLCAATDPDRCAAKEVVLVRGAGEPAEAGTLQVYADADATAYGCWSRRGGSAALQVGCFLRKSATRGVDEDGEEVVLAGRLLVPAAAAAAGGTGGCCALLEEELVSLQVDRLAEGVWNSYFGRWSAWNHYGLDVCEDDD